MGLGGSKESNATEATNNIDESSSSLNGKSSQTPDRRKSKTATPSSSSSSSTKRKHEEISKPNRPSTSRVSQTSSSLSSAVSGASAVVSTDFASTSPSAKKVKRESNVATVIGNQVLEKPELTTSQSPEIVITFSGFKNSSDRFSKTLKKELTQIATSLGVKIAGEQAADIDGKCSLEEEEKYGVQRLDKPLKGRNVYLAESFIATNDSSSLTFKHCHLLVGYGDGKITNSMDDADFCIVGSALEESEEALNKVQEEKEKIVQDYPFLLAFEWAEFVDLIYPFYLEQALRKIEK
ncbi:predicted protein [Naegleria gruberi]|uniref:Predicted protein n=1 Tax=Naegleria gruberi TaxID=5762 RepID=D2V0J2_NAEGR|nr:uncharacterized protein NAEGRDRAFT_45710 [Naegleria gruberi]EFC49731.1 predicted protein [Naegleria gruberi]|eukprot:XP_002682475.1 predicted protein [Naegleria gruberi strain NEG-M]